MFSAFRTTAIGAAALALAAGFAVPAKAAFIATMDQVGANVVIMGMGSFDTAGLTPASPEPPIATAAIAPSSGLFLLGGGGTNNPFTGITPLNQAFGGGGVTDASSNSGAVLGIANTTTIEGLYLPNGYVSGANVSNVTTFLGATFASLGVTPGTYVWTWGTGANADSFTLDIVATTAAPEPASLPLLALGLAGLGMVLSTRRA
jgi:hypothetical protein